jgi:hypothetical protein
MKTIQYIGEEAQLGRGENEELSMSDLGINVHEGIIVSE